jgi:outer membrane protein OmpA-like peptidoglycan-associated protein
MKKVILTSLCAIFALGAFAQSTETQELKPSKDYLVGGFADNWFISGGIGFQTYLSEYYTAGSILGHFSPAVDLSVGKWLTPVFGVRAQLSGLNQRGYNLLSTPYIDANEMVDNVYKMNFYYFDLHADLLFNIHSQFYRYNPERKYELIPFVGMGWFATIKDGLANNEFAANAGIINQFRVNDRLDLDLELKAILIKSDIDGNPAKRFNAPASATIGLTYKIGKAKEFALGHIEPAPIVEKVVDNSELENKTNELASRLADQQKKNNDLNKALAHEKQRANQLNDELEALKKAPKTVKDLTYEDVKINGSFRVFYEIGKTNLDEFNSANLEYIAGIIKKTNKKYIIKGYADKTTGSLSINQKLANKRAENVYNLLIEKYGVNKDMLSIESYVVNPEGNPALVRMTEVK